MSSVDPPRATAPRKLDFCPGGILPTASTSGGGIECIDANRDRLIAAAHAADQTLQSGSWRPSLHVLADTVFASCPAASVKPWADAMVTATATTSVAKQLSQLPPPPSSGPRPCGYVFCRGDIAWNCRQCQQDPTCVICDACFQASDHTGHEVYFHRTAPGGCCDCGDPEAWSVAGCCPTHRPVVPDRCTRADGATNSGSPQVVVDPMEAVRALETPLQHDMPLRAALETVVMAAVYAITVAVEGTGRAADASRFDHGGNDERYRLRLHNDDVHTFEEVIHALQQLRAEDPTGLTRQVDSDGQVIVFWDCDRESVLSSFRLLKEKGLACAAVTYAQLEAELRAQALCAWIAEVGTAHPEAAHCIVKAFEGPLTSAKYIPPYGNLDLFPKNDDTSYLTEQEQYDLYSLGAELFGTKFTDTIAVPPTRPTFSLGPTKSPHALWGTIHSQYAELTPNHPFLNRFRTDPAQTTQQNQLTGQLYVVDTDIRKQQEGEVLASSVYPHNTVPGLHVLQPGASPMQYRHLLQVASFRAPLTPLLWLLLLDPYPTKQLRQALHAIYLSMLTNPRFKARFAGALAVAYRPLTTLFCAGVGTEADTPLQFTVQIFTAGSLVRALQHGPAVEALLRPGDTNDTTTTTEIGCFVPPIAHCITRCVHTNILGSTKEVSMALKHQASAASLVFQAGEHPVYSLLAAAPDDEFLDARSTRHKRLPALLRDLDYVMDTPHTATALLANTQFVAAWCRLLRLAQGMDPQKRRISGGHVEYETNRWLEAFALSLSFSRDAVAENCADGLAVGNGMAGLLREIKLWLYREGILQTGLPTGADRDQGSKLEALQSSTLHIGSDALGCATGVKMTENQLAIIENSVSNPIDWLRVPHSPMAGNALSFHLPLHRAFAKCIKSICALTPDYEKPDWWKIPVLDETTDGEVNPLVPVLHPTIRPANCRVVWSAGPECTTAEAQLRRARARGTAANIAAAKIIYSLADHPARCLSAALQIDRHLWARNGTSVAAMAMNYSSAPLSRSFRDLDLLMVQLSSTGMSCGLGPRRIFSLLVNRFGMEGYLIDPERKGGKWVSPPRLQDPDHATVLAECFFTILCVLVTEIPSPAESALRRNIRRELLHALAAEPRTHSEASQAASCSISRKEETEGSFRETFSDTLREIGKQKSAPGRRSSGPPVFELNPEFCDEYDPSFFHIRRQEHQHAMDVVARLRKQKLGDKKDTHCFPLVCAPPKAHLRFLPCRLLLHLDATDAAVRRVLLFALTNGSWLPPEGPQEQPSPVEIETSTTATAANPSDVPVTSVRYRASRSPGRRPGESGGKLLTAETIALSSVSFLEVLQLLTLQVHTLEECASLHRELPGLDNEGRALSAALSINTYLQRLVHVPESLVDVWALQPYPTGPLRSSGSGENKGSILGLLIALYEHRTDHGAKEENEEYGAGDDEHGGARALVTSGLKWLLRFVHALIDGAASVGAALHSAKTGIPISKSSLNEPTWMISNDIRSNVTGMLKNVPDLWPKTKSLTASPGKVNPKGKEAMKAKQRRVMEMMKLKQKAFAASMGPFDDEVETKANAEVETCIICRCDDSDVENNGPLGYLGHVQRSRMAQLRSSQDTAEERSAIRKTYRVVGHMGCQLRESEAMDSTPLKCLPKGSIVTAMRTKVSDHHDILSRRILVQHVSKDPQLGSEVLTEGWASVQSSQGYVILSPLESLCYSSTRWGTTRPIIKQCGHAAHLKCVDTHTSSLKVRADGDQPYDGRFAANIQEGEFLCPLCKQLSNILIPRARGYKRTGTMPSQCLRVPGKNVMDSLRDILSSSTPTLSDREPMEKKALEAFGSQLYGAMNVPWDRAAGEQKKRQEKWHKSILAWDFEDQSGDVFESRIGNSLRVFRQQLIAWASVGHSAAALEAGARGVEEVLPFGVLSQTSDPWPEYSSDSMDSHPMLLDLKRTMTGAAGHYEVLKSTIASCFSPEQAAELPLSVVGSLLADILDGRSWVETLSKTTGEGPGRLWSELSCLLSAMPYHVSRDGTILQRCEARVTAASMWVCSAGASKETSARSIPPTPLAVQQFLAESSRRQATSGNWGSEILDDKADHRTLPFRPTIAAGYLHLPLIVWDLHTFAGAAFSSLLSVEDDALPSMEELLHVAHRLLVARVVQVIVAPGGLEVQDDMELDEDNVWKHQELPVQAEAIAALVAHCRTIVGQKLSETPSGILGDSSTLSSSAILAAIGSSILPFARALILLLRACTAVVRERKQEGNAEACNAATNALCQNEIMTTEDGFKILRGLHGPLPTSYLDGNWLAVINRWVVASVVLEMHHRSASNTSASASAPSQPADSGELSSSSILESSANNNNHPGASNIILSDDSTDGMDIEEAEADRSVSDHEQMLVHDANFILVNEDGEEDPGGSMDEAEEMVSFVGEDERMGGDTDDGENSMDDVDDDESSGDSSAPVAEQTQASDSRFANLGRSPILLFQPSFLGLAGVGPGRHNTMFDFEMASKVMVDLSHLGTTHRKETPSFTLIRLPKSFVELYNIVNKVKGRDESSGMDDDDSGTAETAICLLTGAVMRSGASRPMYSRANRPPGTCTLHGRKTASGIGIFFLVQKCTVLLMHNNKSAYSPSLYVDEHGEEDPQLKRGKPLFLNEARYRALELLWRQQGIPREVAQIRSTSDRVIRDNWY